jgi:hypothetical protein
MPRPDVIRQQEEDAEWAARSGPVVAEKVSPEEIAQRLASASRKKSTFFGTYDATPVVEENDEEEAL